MCNLKLNACHFLRILTLVNPWLTLISRSVLRYWSTFTQQPANLCNQRLVGILIMSVCTPGNKCLILSQRRTGGVMLGSGYWSWPCTLRAVMMVCYAGSPTVVWPSSSHTVTLRCSSQQQGCRNCARVLFSPLQPIGTASALCSQKRCQIFLSTEIFDCAHIVAAGQSFSLCCTYAGFTKLKVVLVSWKQIFFKPSACSVMIKT